MKPFRVTDGKSVRLKDVDPGDTREFDSGDKPRAKEALAMGIEALAELQDMLYAQDRWAVLLIAHAMDAAGKDGTIKHVMQIGIFNRSSYEETLVVRVHPEFLERQKLPPELVPKDIWKERYKDIRSFERYLTRNGVVVRKFFLHVSKKEKKKRFLERRESPEKNWKFSANDAKEREYWDDSMQAYEDMIRHTATEDAPGTSCPPITSGSPASWSPPPSWGRWARWTSSTRRSVRRSSGSWPQPSGRCSPASKLPQRRLDQLRAHLRQAAARHGDAPAPAGPPHSR